MRFISHIIRAVFKHYGFQQTNMLILHNNGLHELLHLEDGTAMGPFVRRLWSWFQNCYSPCLTSWCMKILPLGLSREFLGCCGCGVRHLETDLSQYIYGCLTGFLLGSLEATGLPQAPSWPAGSERYWEVMLIWGVYIIIMYYIKMINAVYFTYCQWLYINWNIKESQTRAETNDYYHY